MKKLQQLSIRKKILI